MNSISNIIIHDYKCSEATIIDQRVTRHPHFIIIWYNIYLLDRFLMWIYNFPGNIFFFFGSFVMLSGTLLSSRCVFHAPEWKMEIITNYIINILCYTNCKQSTTVINYMCVCAHAPVIAETLAGFGDYIFFFIRRRWSLSFIYISSCAQNVFYLIFFFLPLTLFS